MVAVGTDDSMGAVITTECSKENINSPCLCCVKLKDEMQRVVSEIKSVVERVKILKEDQEQLSGRADNSECPSVKKINTVNNASNNAVCLTDWKTVSQYQRHAKINIVPHQQFKIPKVVNHYAILDKFKEEKFSATLL
jgi:hypothetical protein